MLAMKFSTKAGSTALLVLVLALGTISLVCAEEDAGLTKLLQTVTEKTHQEILEGPKHIVLPNGVTTEVVVLREVRWELKNVPQGVTASMQMEHNTLLLSEEERLKVMNRIANHTQMWFVRLADSPSVGAELKSVFQPKNLPHEAYRELAFLGKADGYAWFGYQPIYQWIYLQKQLGLKHGDDPLAAAVRGLAIEDRGNITANSADAILADAGAAAVPYLEPVLSSTNVYRGLLALSRIPGKEATVVLLRCLASTNRKIADDARRLVEFYPRPELEETYFKWLDQDAGQKYVLDLLRACAKVNKPRLTPLLPRVLAAPKSVHEYRLAFELSRSLAGKDIPPSLLQLEEAIKRYGYRSGPNFDQQKVDAAAAELSHAEDVDAAACIGLSLALATTKGNWRAANLAGIAILKNLPSQRGTKLAKLLSDNCDDDWLRKRLAEVAEP